MASRHVLPLQRIAVGGFEWIGGTLIRAGKVVVRDIVCERIARRVGQSYLQFPVTLLSISVDFFMTKQKRPNL